MKFTSSAIKALCLLLVLMVIVHIPVCCAATSNDTFNMSFWGVVTLSPTRAQSRADYNVLYLLQIQLVRFYGSQIEPDAAISFEKDAEGTRYVFHLRDGLYWENGDRLTAKDFEYGAYCLLAPEMGSPKASSFYEIKNAKAFATGEDTEWGNVGVRALDDLTLEITLEYGVQDYEKTLASKHLYPMNKSFVEEHGIDVIGSTRETVLCSGPYRLIEWRHGDVLRLQKNTLYWQSADAFPTEFINLMQVTDDNAIISMFENEEIDAAIEIGNDYYAVYDKYAYRATSGGIQYLWLNENGKSNETAALMGNKNFRKALSYAVDRTEIVNTINIANQPVSRMVNPFFASPSGDYWVDTYPVSCAPLTCDAETSVAYLHAAMDELGYTSVDDLPELVLMTYADTPQRQECELIISQWKSVLGLKNIRLVSYELNTAISCFFQLDYDLFSIGWETEVRPTDAMRSFMTGGTANAGIWSNPEYDDLVLASLNEGDPLKAADYAWQAEQIFCDEVPMIPLYLSNFESLVHPYVSGYQLGLIDGMEFNHLVVSH